MSSASVYEFYHGAIVCVSSDISVLGIIHAAALRQGPPPLWKFFQRDFSFGLRRSNRTYHRHSKCFIEWPAGHNLEIMKRSAFGMIRVYNILPQEVVDTHDLKAFQKALSCQRSGCGL